MQINFTTILVTLIVCATLIVGLMIFIDEQSPNEVIDKQPNAPEQTEENLPPNQEEVGMEDENQADEPELESPEDDDAPMVACTMDAKECSDGSYVGRVGPDCEFATCPVVSEDEEEIQSPEEQPVACTMDVKECPDGSYVGRKPPTCEFEACPVTQNPSMQLRTVQ